VRGWADVEGEGIVHSVRWDFEAEIEKPGSPNYDPEAETATRKLRQGREENIVQ
jgi:hypothetical protein